MAHAPYNFVPLSENIHFIADEHKVNHSKPIENGVSGTIKFEIETHTPIILGGKITENANGSKTINALELGDNYIIPGASIKGMLRNFLEIATFSRFSMVEDKKFQMRAIGQRNSYYDNAFLYSPERNVRAANLSTGQINTMPMGFRTKVKAGFLYISNLESLFDNDGLDFEKLKNAKFSITPCNYARIEQNELGVNTNDFRDTSNHPQKKYELYKNTKKYERILIDEKFYVEKEQFWAHSKAALFYARAKRSEQNDSIGEMGNLVFTSQQSHSKHMEFFFYKLNFSNLKELSEEVKLSFLQLQQEAFERNKGNKEETIFGYYLKQKKGTHSPIPVFYLLNHLGNVTHLGFSQMFPIAQKNSIYNLRKNSNQAHSNSIKPEKFDFVENLFGRVLEEEIASALKSRVYFSFAKCLKNKANVTRNNSPLIRSSPKASFYPFYLKQQSGAAALKTYLDDDATLAGWKRYPVRTNLNNLETPKELQDKPKIQTTLKPLEKGALFKGAIRVHNLHLHELGALLWALTFSDQPNCFHSLGGGKPYGMGRVSFKINLELENNEVDTETAIASFIAYMNKNIPGWINSPQLTELFAMAKINKNKNLTYMVLGEFSSAKRERSILNKHSAK